MPATKAPELPAERIICLLTGESGSGKTFFIAQLKDAVIYDTDLGGGAAYLDARIKSNGSERVEVNSYMDILADLKKRVADGRMKKNVIIDHITNLQQEATLRANPDMKDDFGRAGNKATYEWRRIRGLIKTLDSNLFVIAHIKAEWADQKMIGKTTDGARNVEGDMQIVLYLQRPGGAGSKLQPTRETPSLAQVVKWRRDPDDPRGLVPLNFPLTMEKFLEIAGTGMTRELANIKLASPEQIAEANRLVDLLKLTSEQTGKWFKKAGVETFDELSSEMIDKFIISCKEMVNKK